VTTTGRFYRDGSGRTRVEGPALVTIMDPVASVTTYLFPNDTTYLQQSWAPAPGEPEQASSADSLQTTQTSLGSRYTEGWMTEGREYTIVIPANSSLGNKTAVTKRARLWLSQELKITVATEIDDPANGPSTHRYTNIVAGTEPAAALFQVPAGYSVQPAPSAPSGPLASRKCTLTINPDPLIIHSFGPLLGRGTVAATTNANRGCFIAYWAAIWQSPLRLQILTPLGLPAFSVRWRDGGGSVPFVPWVAFGDIAILATNFLDTTTKDGLVVLTVWF
jgi:hypothetical protein